MQTILHRADSRGFADHGWLKSHHTFSFASYFNPERIQFGALRVLNDDQVAPGKGFPTHPHDNMEIVSIPLQGALKHKDSMGNEHIIRTGEVQIMSAGSGITHSEYNNSDAEEVNFLQIWILPDQRNIAPRYGQKFFEKAGRTNQFQMLVSPDKKDDQAIWINQSAYFQMAEISSATTLEYSWHKKGQGTYFFVIDGEVEIGNHHLKHRDALGVTDAEKLEITALSESQVLAIEVPFDEFVQ